MDCGAPRCSNDRRVLKRELLSWSRKIPVLIGLESLATEVCGRRNYKKVLQVLQPFRDTKKTNANVSDFHPNNDCSFCEFDEKNNTKLEDTSNNNDTMDIAAAAAAYSITNCTTNTSTAASSYMQSLLSAYVAAACSQSTLSTTSTSNCRQIVSNSQTSLPVDLTSQQLNQKQAPLQNIGPIKRKESKRGYTEDELRTALKEIKSGRLGTRRAAVLYGIPRSTLRNKIFKMSLQEQSQKVDDLTNNINNKEKIINKSNQVISENVLKKGQRDLTITDLLATPSFIQKEERTKLVDLENDLSTANWSNRLDILRQKHRLDSVVQHPFLPQSFMDDQNLALWSALCTAQLLQLSQLSQLSSIVDSPNVSSIIPQISKQLVNEKFQGIRKTKDENHQPTISRRLNGDNKDTIESQVELKIPNYKARLLSSEAKLKNNISGNNINNNNNINTNNNNNNNNHNNNNVNNNSNNSNNNYNNNNNNNHNNNKNHYHNKSSSSTTNGHLKDTIAKSLTNKLRSRTCDKSLEKIMAGQFNQETTGVVSSNSSEESSNCNSMPPPVKRAKRACSKKEEDVIISSGEKKTRPKRGQYRKYNSQLLLEAVAAVQRGEMSVHRAGSYFGVPHSTLEYKVKERHLLRKKSKELNNSKSNKCGNIGGGGGGVGNKTLSENDHVIDSRSESCTSLSTNAESEFIEGNNNNNSSSCSPNILNTSSASELLKSLHVKVENQQRLIGKQEEDEEEDEEDVDADEDEDEDDEDE